MPTKTNKCVDCDKLIWTPAIRCKACSNKSRSTRVPKYCIVCGTEINRLAKKRCLSCHNKNQDKGLSRARTKFNVSPKWKKAREACFKRDDWTCQHCNTKGGVLNAHHIKGYCNYPKLRLNLNNLITLCIKCHKAHHAENGYGKNG